jgi:hypothetical protein
MDGIYVYCIMNGVHADAGLPEATVAGSSPVEILQAARLSAVVSPVEGFDVTAEQQVLLRRLAAHQEVIEHFLAQMTVLPVKFGTVLESRDEVLAMLVRSRRELTDWLTRNDGFIEVDVAVTWADMTKVFGDLAAHPEILTMRSEVERLGPEARLDGVARLGKRVKELLDQKAADVSSAVLSAVLPKARDMATNELRDDSMLLNAAFLIAREAEDRFTRALEELNVQYADVLDFRLIGPLPPYSFATVQVRRYDAGSLLNALGTLELPPVASLREVRSAHRKLGRALHPDRQAADLGARQRFEDVNRAFLILEDYLLNFPCRFVGGPERTVPFAVLKRQKELLAECRP